jgi:hypothetical protein
MLQFYYIKLSKNVEKQVGSRSVVKKRQKPGREIQKFDNKNSRRLDWAKKASASDSASKKETRDLHASRFPGFPT